MVRSQIKDALLKNIKIGGSQTQYASWTKGEGEL